MGSQRGKIVNKKRRQQIVDYSGLRYKNITPTDIDGVGEFYDMKGYFEIRNQVFIFIELKLAGTELSWGQKTAFERLVDALKYPAIFIIAEHDIEDTNEEIPAHLCLVREYKSNGKWYKPKSELTLKELVDKYLLHYGLGKYLNNNDL